MRVVNFFDTIQGEGYYAGRPVRLVRLHGCNLKCNWCDSKFASEGNYVEMSPEELLEKITGHDSYLWTGGEPMLQAEEIIDVVTANSHMLGSWHALETNGTILTDDLEWFDWIAFSPKSLVTLEKCKDYIESSLYITSDRCEIKVVTDLETIGADMVPFADCILPLTTGQEFVDLKVARKVWEFCAKNRKRYSPRLHIGVGLP